MRGEGELPRTDADGARTGGGEARWKRGRGGSWVRLDLSRFCFSVLLPLDRSGVVDWRFLGRLPVNQRGPLFQRVRI